MIETLCLLANASLDSKLCIRNIDLATVVVEESSLIELCISLTIRNSDITLYVMAVSFQKFK